MKLVLCLLIVALSAYIGRLFSKKAAVRLDYFRGYQSGIIYLTDRVIGMNLELYKALSTNQNDTMHNFFCECAKMLRNAPQQRFARIWQACFMKYQPSYLAGDDLNVILSGGEAIETLCANPSEKQAQAYIKRLAAYLDEMEADKRKKCKIFNTAGVLTGLFIALLVI
ncbi:MAG: stage III sporulation protein AB [Eubacteriales bacterium]|nr:stage III sporulation protein AB [Eubacteriales bacterium]